MQHPPNPYALKPVLSAPTSIRPSQYEAMEIIKTAARWFEVTKTQTPKTEPQKLRVKNSLIDSPHPEKNAPPPHW